MKAKRKRKKTKKISQGAKANFNGKKQEKAIEKILNLLGFPSFMYSAVKKNPKLLEGKSRYVLENVPYTNIYESTSYSEFVLFDLENNLIIRIESKYQATRGSVDEKYPFMWDNAVQKQPEPFIFFIFGGGGYRPGAIKHLQNCIDNNEDNYKERGKDIRLYFMDTFEQWAKETFSQKSSSKNAA